MTNEELKDLFVDYAERYPLVTIGELCNDLDIHTEDRNIMIGDLGIIHSDISYKGIKKSDLWNGRDFNGSESWILIKNGKILGYTNGWTESKMALLKVLVDGKEDLI